MHLKVFFSYAHMLKKMKRGQQKLHMDDGACSGLPPVVCKKGLGLHCRQAVFLLLQCWHSAAIEAVWVWHCFAEICNGRMCCSKTCIYRLVLMVPFQMCQLPIPYTLMGPPCHQRCRFLNLALVLSRVVPLIFSSRDVPCSKINVQFQFV